MGANRRYDRSGPLDAATEGEVRALRIIAGLVGRAPGWSPTGPSLSSSRKSCAPRPPSWPTGGRFRVRCAGPSGTSPTPSAPLSIPGPRLTARPQTLHTLQGRPRRPAPDGSCGEAAVADLLGELTEPSWWAPRRVGAPTWRVLHSIPLADARGHPRGDIDHLLVGPPGVFTINTKHHRTGKLRLDGDELVLGGRRTDYVPTARREAGHVASTLSASLPTGRPPRTGRRSRCGRSWWSSAAD